MDKQILISGLSMADFNAMIARLVEDAVEKKVKLLALQPTEQKQILTSKETAALLGVSLPTLNAWEKAGILIPFRLGVKVRYRFADIQTTIAAQLKNAA